MIEFPTFEQNSKSNKWYKKEILAIKFQHWGQKKTHQYLRNYEHFHLICKYDFLQIS